MGALVGGRGKHSYRQPVLEVSARSRMGPLLASVCEEEDDDAVSK
jgi:hypothetical protein